MANPYAPAGHVATTGGGHGSWDEASDPTNALTYNFDVSTLNLFFHTYNILAGDIPELVEYFWSAWTSIQRYFTKADDAILDLHILPLNYSDVSHAAVGSSPAVNNDDYKISMGLLEDIKINNNLSLIGKLITQPGITLDCGRIYIDEYSGSFLDYDENTQISLYLPYIGTVPLDTSTAMGKYINIIYKIDVITGNCCANIYACETEFGTYKLIGSYDGNCAYVIPVSSVNFMGTIQSVVSGAIGIAGTVAGLLA